MNDVEKVKNYDKELKQELKIINNLIINTPFLEKIKHPIKLIKNYQTKFYLNKRRKGYDNIYSRLTYYGMKIGYLRTNDISDDLIHNYNVYEKKLVKYVDKHPIKR